MRGMDGDKHRMLEWRKITALAKFQFLFDVARKIVMVRKLDRGRKGCVALHENFSRRLAAPGAPGHLGEQLKGSLARTKARKMQRYSGIDDSNESDVWKMQTLRDHLRPNQDVDLARTKCPQCFPIGFFA